MKISVIGKLRKKNPEGPDPVGPVAPEDLDTEGAEEAGSPEPDLPGEHGDLEHAITRYNAVYTEVSDNGLSLFRQRDRSVDLIKFIEVLVNSIANTPKSFATDFQEITANRRDFREVEEIARLEIENARRAVLTGGAGAGAGVAVVGVAPTAAMWVATTFGTASTGTAISTLSGAAASNAAVAWLGGGALAAGGGGMAAGNALLALAGPIGWTIAGAGVLTSVVLITGNKISSRRKRQEKLEDIKRNTASLEVSNERIVDLLHRTTELREKLAVGYGESLNLFGADYLALSAPQRDQLVALVNNTLACSAMLKEHIEHDAAAE